jgi:hypothetical protein
MKLSAETANMFDHMNFSGIFVDEKKPELLMYWLLVSNQLNYKKEVFTVSFITEVSIKLKR